MILSRLMLDPRNASARRDLTNPYQMHRTVRRLCPEGVALWRIEEAGLLLQSAAPPDWSRLPKGYAGSLPSQRSFDVEQLELDGTLRFRLMANVKVTRRATGKRESVTGLEPQRTWLQQRATAAGFAVETLGVSSSSALVFPGKRPGQTITLSACLFEGTLHVVSRPAFERTVVQGLGSGKAFGMGLLSLAAV